MSSVLLLAGGLLLLYAAVARKRAIGDSERLAVLMERFNDAVEAFKGTGLGHDGAVRDIEVLQDEIATWLRRSLGEREAELFRCAGRLIGQEPDEDAGPRDLPDTVRGQRIFLRMLYQRLSAI